jgi:Mor family transcriptional regulator
MSIEFFTILSSIMDFQLAEQGISASKATLIKDGLFKDIKKHLAGQSVYFKTISNTATRHKAICSEFNGGNHKELMVKYQLGYSWLTTILRKGGIEHDQAF